MLTEHRKRTGSDAIRRTARLSTQGDVIEHTQSLADAITQHLRVAGWQASHQVVAHLRETGFDCIASRVSTEISHMVEGGKLERREAAERTGPRFYRWEYRA
jgi:hypothetical protein